jgi:hypothetical protein
VLSHSAILRRRTSHPPAHAIRAAMHTLFPLSDHSARSHCCATVAVLRELHVCHKNPKPILRSQLLGWRITCPHCGDPLRDAGGHEFPAPFRQYCSAAFRGEKLLDDEAAHGIRTWTSPAEIARHPPDAANDVTPAARARALALQGARCHRSDLDYVISSERETANICKAYPAASPPVCSARRGRYRRACRTGDAPNAAWPHAGRQQGPIH